jgi:hypothetical protein
MIQLFGQWALGNYWNSWGGNVRLIRYIGDKREEG